MNALYFPLYLAWSTTWLLVMWFYSRAAIASWRTGGGVWAAVPGLLASFGRWFLVEVGRDLIAIVRRRTRVTDPMFDHPAEAGTWLRFFVGASALNLGFLGLVTSMVDRSAWPAWLHVGTIAGVALSMAAGQGHLALAWSHRPRLWRCYILACLLWMPFGVWLRLRF